MEETLARHTGSESFVTFPFWFPNIKLFTLCLVYEQSFHPSQHPQGRPDSRGGATRQDYGAPQVYGWKPANFEQPSYGPYPGPANAYPPQDAAGVPVPFDRSTPVGSGLVSQQPKLQGYSDPNVSSPYGAVSAPLSGTAATSQPQQQQQHIQAGYGTVGQGGYGHQPNVPYTQQGPVPYPSQQQRFSNRLKLSLSRQLLNPSQFSSTSSLKLSMSSCSHSSLSHNLKRSKRKPSPRLIFRHFRFLILSLLRPSPSLNHLSSSNTFRQNIALLGMRVSGHFQPPLSGYLLL